MSYLELKDWTANSVYLDDVSHQDLRCSQIQAFFDSGVLRVSNDDCLVFEDGLCYLGSLI